MAQAPERDTDLEQALFKDCQRALNSQPRFGFTDSEGVVTDSYELAARLDLHMLWLENDEQLHSVPDTGIVDHD